MTDPDFLLQLSQSQNIADSANLTTEQTNPFTLVLNTDVALVAAIRTEVAADRLQVLEQSRYIEDVKAELDELYPALVAMVEQAEQWSDLTNADRVAVVGVLDEVNRLLEVVTRDAGAVADDRAAVEEIAVQADALLRQINDTVASQRTLLEQLAEQEGRANEAATQLDQFYTALEQTLATIAAAQSASEQAKNEALTQVAEATVYAQSASQSADTATTQAAEATAQAGIAQTHATAAAASVVDAQAVVDSLGSMASDLGTSVPTATNGMVVNDTRAALMTRPEVYLTAELPSAGVYLLTATVNFVLSYDELYYETALYAGSTFLGGVWNSWVYSGIAYFKHNSLTLLYTASEPTTVTAQNSGSRMMPSAVANGRLVWVKLADVVSS